MDEALERLKILLNSNASIVVIETVEEMRAVNLVREACSELRLAVFEWTIADGLVRSGSKVPVDASTAANENDFVVGDWAAFRHHRGTWVSGNADSSGSAAAAAPEMASPGMYNTRDPNQALANMAAMTVDGVFIMKDLHRHMDDPAIVRRLRDVAQRFSINRRTVVITAPEIRMPRELASLVEYLDIPLPGPHRLREIIDETFNRMSRSLTIKRRLDDAGLNAMAENLRGLTEGEAERALSQALVSRYELSAETVTEVLEKKRELLRRSGMLDSIEVTENMASLGGLENLKRWLAERRGSWQEEARDFGLEPPRGVIILGVQGCGKSLCARGIAGEWGLPLVKFDTAAIFDKYVGETEKRIQKVFSVAEGLAPCVLWIDELEKVFAGSTPDSASADAGVSSRLLASFLTWMQERKAPVFVAATCNNVGVLPPELIRKGRFDELFFVDLPNRAERRSILQIQLKRRKRNPADFDLQALEQKTQSCSGAEIEAAIQAALYRSFSEKQPMTTQTLLQALANTVPLSTTRSEEITELRNWARQRAVSASAPDGA